MRNDVMLSTNSLNELASKPTSSLTQRRVHVCPRRRGARKWVRLNTLRSEILDTDHPLLYTVTVHTRTRSCNLGRRVAGGLYV